MQTIPTSRTIYPRMFVGRNDGITYVDVTDYLQSVDIELGNVADVGVSEMGGDGVVRKMNFTLRNNGSLMPAWDESTAQDESYVVGEDDTVIGDETEGAELFFNLLFGTDEKYIRESFSPRDQNSSYNQLNGTYSPLLWPMRKVYFRCAITSEPEQESGTTMRLGVSLGLGNGTQQTYQLAYYPVLQESETIYINSTPLDQSDPSYSINYDTGVLTITAPNHSAITIDYTYEHTMFVGYLGDDISPDGATVSCASRDLGMFLQQKYIKTPKEYGSATGVLAHTVIQQILDDNLGAGVVTLVTPVTPEFAVKTYTLEYKSVWDAIQQIAGQVGWFLGYVWDEATNDFQLKFYEPPREKNGLSADFLLTAQNDFYTHSPSFSIVNTRNALKLSYFDTALGQKVTLLPEDHPELRDDASIAEFGERLMEIEEKDTSLISTQQEALTFGQYVIADLKDIIATANIVMPLMPLVDVFSGINIDDPRVSSSVDFYGVESVRHRLSLGNSCEFRTEVSTNGKVIGSRQRWLKMQTRPGSGEPIKGTSIVDLNPIIYIAASNTSERRKQLANYICTGFEDQNQINTAINSLEFGGKIHMLEGTYYVNAPIKLKSNITLDCSSFGTIIKASPSCTSNFNIFEANETTLIKDCKIYNAKVDGNSAENTVQIKGGYFKNTSGCSFNESSIVNCYMGVDFDNSNEFTVSKVEVSDNQIGLRLYQSHSFVAESVKVFNNTNEGIYCFMSDKFNLQNSIVNNNRTGIKLELVTNSNISQNVVSLNTRDGIYCDVANYNTISNNVVTENGQTSGQDYSNILMNASSFNNVQINKVRRGVGAITTGYGVKLQRDTSSLVHSTSNVVTNNDLLEAGRVANLQDGGLNTVTTAGNRI